MVNDNAMISKVTYVLKPLCMMVLAQAMLAGITVFYKIAANDGMVLPVLIAYRFLFATAFMVPLSLFIERKMRKPKLTWMILLQLFFCGLFGGSVTQNLYVKALSSTSATFVASTTNLAPALTFILAVCFRMEKLGLKTKSGLIKILGTVLGVSGAMVLTLYKGVDLHIWKTNVDLLKGQHLESSQYSSHWLIGAVLAFTSSITYCMWLIIQANLVKDYPFPYSVTALTSAIGSIQAVVYGLCTERNWKDWKLEWNIRLLSAAYTGIVGSGLMFVLIAWCVHLKGPLFVSSFNPLMIVFVSIAGFLLLDEGLHLGSLLGVTLIIIGLYAVLWGKAQEAKKSNDQMQAEDEINIV